MHRARAWPELVAVAVCVACVACAGALSSCINAPVDERCDFDTDCHVGQICAGGACADALVDAGAAPVDGGFAHHDAGVSGQDAGASPLDGGGGSGDDGGEGVVDGGSHPIDSGPAVCGGNNHDGGDGTCLPLGQCSPGFARLYVDGDGDGRGAGPQRDQCDPVPAHSGLSASDDDCDDGNASAFTFVTGFLDADGDGFTAGNASLCTDGSLPGSLRVSEQLAPVLLVPASASAAGFGWSQVNNAVDCCGDDASFPFEQGGGTASTLTLSGYACAAVPVRVDAIRAHVSIGTSFAFLSAQGTVTAALVVDGVLGDAVEVEQDLAVNDVGDLFLSGSADQWGFPGLSPSALCDGNTALRLDIAVAGGFAFPIELQIDYAMLEVTGGNDCDDGDAASFASENIFVDGDGDGESTSAIARTCTGVTDLALPKNTKAGNDCDDT
ncbi:MAG TPA: hypothetical protein VGO62_16140, partial [Myxococcota bacterium]